MNDQGLQSGEVPGWVLEVFEILAYIHVIGIVCCDCYLLLQLYTWHRHRRIRVRQGQDDDENTRQDILLAQPPIETLPERSATPLTLPYQYRPIQSGQHVRLLVLRGGNRDEPIHCAFEEMYIGDEDSGPSVADKAFEAISYRWSGSHHAVLCEGRYIPVPQTVCELLVQLRYPDRQRLIWIDALCINQMDPEEKALQIPLMSQIYTKCTRCIVWLGQHDQDDILAFKLLHKLRRVKTSIAIRRAFNSNAASGATVGPHSRDDLAILRPFEASQRKDLTTLDQWHALRKMLQNPWFERIWTFQEAVLPKDILMMRGLFQITGDDFYSALDLIENTDLRQYLQESHGTKSIEGMSCEQRIAKWMPLPLDLEKSSTFGLIQSLKVAKMRRRFHHNHRFFQDKCTRTEDILSTLRAARERNTCDLRDKVIGIIGLCRLSDVQALNLQHLSTASDVYKAIALHALQKENPLRLLFAAGEHSFNRADVGSNLPSWIPNWAVRISLTKRMEIFERTSHFCAGGRDLKPKIELAYPEGVRLQTKSSPLRLCLEGKIISSLARIMAPNTQDLEGYRRLAYYRDPEQKSLVEHWFHFNLASMPSMHQVSSWLEAFIKQAGKKNSLAISPSVHLAFLRACYDNIEYLHGASPRTMDLFEKLLTCEATEGPREQRMVSIERNSLDRSALFWDYQTTRFHEDLEAWTWERNFCVTDDEHFGWVPLFARPGDKVCVLAGCSLPVILRKDWSHNVFKLVGHCYITDVMHGEAMPDEKYPLQDIWLA